MQLAWLTDIHLNFVDCEEVNRLCDDIRTSGADAVLITGDIATALYLTQCLDNFATTLQMPVYFVLGNHDYYGSSIREVNDAVGQLISETPLLTWLSACPAYVPLTDTTCLVGHEGLADGRMGNPEGSEVFEIEGNTFLAFGGAMSHDKDPGWVPQYTSKYNFGGFGADREWNKGRTEGKDWWPEEIPSREDFENACHNLDRVGWKVDYVISHTCPVSQRAIFGGRKHLPDPTETMLQELLDRGLEFGAWHFGHFHEEQREGKFSCHYNKVEPLGGVVTWPAA